MKNFKIHTTIALVVLAFFTSCTCSSPSDKSVSERSSSNSSSNPSEKDPYEIMHIAFEGSPEIDEIKSLLEVVMDNFSFPKTDENRLKLANGLVVLRKASTVGVTEMDILKHIYQHGTNKISLAEQLGLSATILETSK